MKHRRSPRSGVVGLYTGSQGWAEAVVSLRTLCTARTASPQLRTICVLQCQFVRDQTRLVL